MPRYFFDLVNGGGLLRDEEGVELDGPERAHDFAIQSARDVTASEIREGREVHLGHFVTVRGPDGREIERVTFRQSIRFAD